MVSIVFYLINFIQKSNMELTHRQITCQRQIADDEFPKGVMDYNFSLGGKIGFIPNHSYFRIEVEVNGAGAGVAPFLDENVALADGLCSNLFNNVYVKMGGQDVSTLTNFCGQAGMVKTRLEKSGAWLSSIGKQFGFDADRQKRLEQVSADRPLSGTSIALTMRK